MKKDVGIIAKLQKKKKNKPKSHFDQEEKEALKHSQNKDAFKNKY